MRVSEERLFTSLMQRCGLADESAATEAWVIPGAEPHSHECAEDPPTSVAGALSALLQTGSQRWLAAARHLARDADLRARVARLETENSDLKSALSDLSRRLQQFEAEREAEVADYLQREAALYEFAKTLPAPPDYGTDDPWEIANREGERIGVDKLRELLSED